VDNFPVPLPFVENAKALVGVSYAKVAGYTGSMSRQPGSQPIRLLMLLVVCALAVWMLRGPDPGFSWLDTADLQPSRDTERSDANGAAYPDVRKVETPTMRGYAYGAIQVYFTRPQDGAPASEQQPGLDQTVATDLERASRSIELATFDFDLPRITQALLNAHKRGVHIRMVVDSENLEDPGAARLLGTLEQAGIVVTYDRRAGFMHNKFIVIDDRILWTGSWNLTHNDTFRNNNNLVRVEDTRIAHAYRTQFATLANERSTALGVATSVELDGTSMEALFSPDMPITTQVAEAIAQAHHSVDFLAFTFTSDALGDAMVAAKARGVRVQGVIENRNARSSGSERDAFRDAGIAVLEDGNCFLMHHKTIIIDGETVITGSFNWTAAAQQINDENILMLHGPWIAHVYAQEFGRVWAQAQQPTKCG
jgi:phosphatidylserine/phosphatidylglycerophosphate/cardiolipin synthase-like enzyme